MRTTRDVWACLLLLAAAATGQDLAANLEQKLAQPFVKNAAWVTDFDAARKKAREANRPIFAYFTRSYAP
ncbi:MAG: hypothetical protein ACYTEZ_14350 [Planctomycetota bacterium]|jgi:hypothetical protein